VLADSGDVSELAGICTLKLCYSPQHGGWPVLRQVLVSDPKELEKIREREFDITKERIQKILAAGANVVLTTKGIDDMSLKYFVEAGAIACRRVPKDDLRHVPHPPRSFYRWAFFRSHNTALFAHPCALFAQG
jgi:TCP-1/cpn60 chaperonin family